MTCTPRALGEVGAVASPIALIEVFGGLEGFGHDLLARRPCFTAVGGRAVDDPQCHLVATEREDAGAAR